jgi:nicotinate-nucleotide adenylyltransferase
MLSGAPSYTSTTLDRLAARGIDTREIVLITGADAFRDIATWRDYLAILDRCHFAVVSRPGVTAASLRQALPELSDRMVDGPCDAGALTRPRVILVDAPTAPVSSTEIRRRVSAGQPIDGLVPDNVARHIGKHGLYRRADLDLSEGPLA